MVGETIVSVLGLEESMYQDVLDNMNEEEMRAAEKVNAERSAEHDTRLAYLESVETADIEGPTTCGESTIDSPTLSQPTVETPNTEAQEVEIRDSSRL